jgi:dihydroflavonol-4-reductase
MYGLWVYKNYMRVLITGGTGFVGSWLVKRLVEEGMQVRLLHRPNSSLAEVEGFRFESAHGDVTDLDSVVDACTDIDTVFHLAGVVGYAPSLRGLMDKVNVGGTANVVEACRRKRVRRLVHMSSVVAIGASFKPQLLHENSPYMIGNLDLGYFETKRLAEEKVREAARRGEVDAVMVNPSTVYGPGDAKKGSRKVQVKVARGKFPFYPSGGASIVSVHDVVDGIIKAWRIGRTGERYILSGENLYIRDLFRKIAKLGGVRPPWIPLPRPVALAMGRVGDRLESMGKKTPINTENAWTSSLFHWFDSSKAKIELGFQASSADQALAESVNWMKENGYL